MKRLQGPRVAFGKQFYVRNLPNSPARRFR